MGPDRAWIKWLGVSALIVVLDQFTKYWVASSMQYGQRIEVLPFFSWVRWHNEGAAFSLLSDAGGWQRWFFVALAVAFVTFIVYELRRLPERERLMGLVYGLIVGGAVGNLIDRAWQGHVVDFVLLHAGRFYFPAFNIADMALSVGAVLWIGLLILEYRRDRRAQVSS